MHKARTHAIQTSMLGIGERTLSQPKPLPSDFFLFRSETEKLLHVFMQSSSNVLYFIALFLVSTMQAICAAIVEHNLIPRQQLDDFTLLSSEIQWPPTGIVRKHYVKIEEITWDYSPDQWDHYHNKSLSESPAMLWTSQSKWYNHSLIHVDTVLTSLFIQAQLQSVLNTASQCIESIMTLHLIMR